MKILKVLSFAPVVLGASLAASVALADHMNVNIHNTTGYAIIHFYSTNSGADRWGSDILRDGYLPNGNYITMNFDNNYGHCLYDFRAEFEDGTVLQRGGVNVCEISDYYYEE
ncbi:MAG TPA: hypothetical protein PK450_10795 [Paracoccaceae bacterium]|nr:hypothetical protein [Paracoccaceae bacterium]